MATHAATPLEYGRMKLAKWRNDGEVGPPPERDIYTSDRHGISAFLDPFTPYRIGAVVFSHTVAPEGETAHLADMAHSQRALFGHVVHAVGGRLLAATRGEESLVVIDPDLGEQRVLERVDGFAIPRQGHVRMGIGYRHEPERSNPTEKDLDVALELTAIRGDEAERLDAILDAQALISDIIDGPMTSDSLRQMGQIAAIVNSGMRQPPATGL